MYDESSTHNQLTEWLLRETPKKGLKHIAPLVTAVASDIGRIRSENQDRAVVARGVTASGEGYTILALADGMGGMSDGAQCAAITLGEFVETFHRGMTVGVRADVASLMWVAANEANQKVYKKYAGRGGSTLVAVVLMSTGVAYSLSVGDSRIYGFGREGLVSLSVDDTIAGQLGRPVSGLEQNRLLQFIGMGSDLEPHINELDYLKFRYLLLTSDGIHYLDKYSDLMAQVIANSLDINFSVRRLLELAGWVGGHDNASIIMISLDSASLFERSKSYLEIWDAYDGVQFLVHERSVRSAPPPYISKSDEGKKDYTEQPIVSAKKSTKKSEPKSKGSRSRSKKKSEDPKPPEEKSLFQMEFPTNEKE
jgi:serine/threonine protein phosphatase PrpC